MRKQGSDSLSKEGKSLLKLRVLLLSSLAAYSHDFLIHTIYAYVLFRGRSRAELDCISGLHIPQVIIWSNLSRWAVSLKLQLFKKRLNLILGHRYKRGHNIWVPTTKVSGLDHWFDQTSAPFTCSADQSTFCTSSAWKHRT